MLEGSVSDSEQPSGSPITLDSLANPFDLVRGLPMQNQRPRSKGDRHAKETTLTTGTDEAVCPSSCTLRLLILVLGDCPGSLSVLLGHYSCEFTVPLVLR
jgi:hypothetical protein